MERSCSVAALAQRLLSGEAAIFPTDTLPALASRPEQAAQLWQLKGRPQDKPVILMGASAADLWQGLGIEPLPEWRSMAEHHWPGALTLVLPARSSVVAMLNPGGCTLGVRVPACAVAVELLRATGPLATTSANQSGEPPCLTAEEAAIRFPKLARLGPEPWPRPSGQASTVLLWNSSGGWDLLRRGSVLPLEVEQDPRG
jgi:L-threonylcarbamoyladenylate synthase